MGAAAALPSPVELIRVQRGGSCSFRCAVAEMQGWRGNHEDAHSMSCGRNSGSFWVLDGHGGDGSALYAATALAEGGARCQSDDGKLPSTDVIEKVFETVDVNLRAHIDDNPTVLGLSESGATVVGIVVCRLEDQSYSLKLVNCGDARGVICRGPDEVEGKADESSCTVHVPPNIASGLSTQPVWPVISESVDHKPDHPLEQARIEQAGGKVSTARRPARVDGILAVSRGVGDFEFKSDSSRSPADQKVTCKPDVYELVGLKEGTICILACDGLWDVMKSHVVAAFVQDWLKREPNADLGDIAVDLVRQALELRSRDNVTVMIIQCIDGSAWAQTSAAFNGSDEMKYFQEYFSKSNSDDDSDFPEMLRSQYDGFLERCGFPLSPQKCSVSGRWYKEMVQCSVTGLFYSNGAHHRQGLEKVGFESEASEATSLEVTLPRPKTAEVEDSNGDLRLTVVNVSGEIAYGPVTVGRSVIVRDLKNCFDKDIKKELLLNDRFLEDDDTLQCLPRIAEVQLVVGLVSDPTLRALAAATALETVNVQDLKTFVTVTSNSGILLLRLVYTGCLLALAAVHGEDSESAFWSSFEGFPLDSAVEDVEVGVPNQDASSGHVRVRQLRTDKYWPRGKLLPAERFIDGIKTFDHRALGANLHEDVARYEELRHLLASPNLTYRHLSRLQDSSAFYTEGTEGPDERWQSVQRCMVALMKWLCASVAPLVRDLSASEGSLIIRTALGFSRRGKSGRDQTLLRSTFEQWDVDGDGTISQEELKSVLLELDPRFTGKLVEDLFAAADSNKDGLVDYQEFLTWLFK